LKNVIKLIQKSHISKGAILKNRKLCEAWYIFLVCEWANYKNPRNKSFIIIIKLATMQLYCNQKRLLMAFLALGLSWIFIKSLFYLLALQAHFFPIQAIYKFRNIEKQSLWDLKKKKIFLFTFERMFLLSIDCFSFE